MFEGDIDMSKQEAIDIIMHHAVTPRQRRATAKNRARLWPKNVPYAIDGSLGKLVIKYKFSLQWSLFKPEFKYT